MLWLLQNMPFLFEGGREFSRAYINGDGKTTYHMIRVGVLTDEIRFSAIYARPLRGCRLVLCFRGICLQSCRITYMDGSLAMLRYCLSYLFRDRSIAQTQGSLPGIGWTIESIAAMSAARNIFVSSPGLGGEISHSGVIMSATMSD